MLTIRKCRHSNDTLLLGKLNLMQQYNIDFQPKSFLYEPFNEKYISLGFTTRSRGYKSPKPFILLINVEKPTIVYILTFLSKINFMLS